ncbi:RNA-binding protein cabeza-like [Hyla sarda]|uniref:RNA-binding protein cabeza-like n=1 Tax=Hyla sarda TaxID=327740 RepID=UPI0024C3E201|nr:RNA-binding protein cabeza-like [Hyla sarda]
MDRYLILGLVLGAIVAAHTDTLPTIPWDDEDVSVMCLISTDYYNKVSGESALYRLHGNCTEYKANETSSYHQLHFTIKETTCQKSEEEATEDCAILEDGLVKLCAASIMMEDDRDVIVVTCDNAAQQRSRVRRSRSGGRGNRGGGNRGRGNGGRGNGGRGNGGRGNGGGGNGGRGNGGRGNGGRGNGGGRAGSGSSIAGVGSRGGTRHA